MTTNDLIELIKEKKAKYFYEYNTETEFLIKKGIEL
jgi:hypothetical protein